MKISVVGSINIDMVVTADRIPLKGETLHGESLDFHAGGKGANQAVAAARVGANVTMFACVGQDDFGVQMVENLKANNVDTSHIQKVEKVSTGTALITVGEGDNAIVIVAGANKHVTPSYIDSVKNELLKSDMVVLQHEIPEETNTYVVDLCYANDIPVILNPAPARDVDKELIKKLTYLTPNEHEVSLIFGDEVECQNALEKYHGKLLVTQGSEGVLVHEGGKNLLVPARKSEVADTTGAGDTFNGVFAARIVAGDDLTQAIAYANVAAGLSVEKHGAQGGMPMKEIVELECGK